MKTYFIRAEEKFTSYQVSIYKIEADSKEEAKQILLADNGSIEPEDTWITDSIDYEWIEQDNWEIEEGKK